MEIWAWCDICEDMIALDVDKNEIHDGLEMGIYTKEFKHVNTHPDPEDPDEKSSEEHTIYVYIDPENPGNYIMDLSFLENLTN